MKQLKSLFYYTAIVMVGMVFTQCKEKAPTKTEAPKVDISRIIEADNSKVCDVFTSENPDKVKISQNFADMNLRRQAKDFGPGEYSAFDYWQKVYADAPGFSILVYTDGSAIFREMAAKAKEDGDDAKYKEYTAKAFQLLEQGETCYPETKGRFGPSKAYILEMTQPGKYQEILDLYTEGLSAKTDAYSLGSIARYASYLGYIDEIPVADANALVSKVRGIAAAKKGERDYDYILEQIDGVKDQYTELYAEKEAAAEEAKANQGTTSSEGADAYNAMLTAVDNGDLATAHTKFKEYVANEEDAERKYATAMYIGGSHYGADDYPKAREAYQIAMQANPSIGDPYYQIGLMYLSSGPKCGPGTGFDSQRVIWPAFDKFKVALSKEVSEAVRTDINKNMTTYKDFLPSKAQIAEQGLTVGDSYNVPCWINESTTVVSNGK